MRYKVIEKWLSTKTKVLYIKWYDRDSIKVPKVLSFVQ